MQLTTRDATRPFEEAEKYRGHCMQRGGLLADSSLPSMPVRWFWLVVGCPCRTCSLPSVVSPTQCQQMHGLSRRYQSETVFRKDTSSVCERGSRRAHFFLPTPQKQRMDKDKQLTLYRVEGRVEQRQGSTGSCGTGNEHGGARCR